MIPPPPHYPSNMMPPPPPPPPPPSSYPRYNYYNPYYPMYGHPNYFYGQQPNYYENNDLDNKTNNVIDNSIKIITNKIGKINQQLIDNDKNNDYNQDSQILDSLHGCVNVLNAAYNFKQQQRKTYQ